MRDGPFPVLRTGRQVVVTLPEDIDAANAGQFREQLLALVNQGASVLIADMSGTASCDHGGAEALVRAYHRGSVSGTQLRLVVTAPVVRRVLDVSGLDRLVSIYPSLDAAQAAGTPSGAIRIGPAAGGTGAARRQAAAAVTPAVLWGLADALRDGMVLASGDGTLVLASRRAEDMFGYQRDEMPGLPVEALVPDGVRAAHASQRDRYAKDPVARQMGSRARLAGLRKDGTTFPARISLSPVPTATGQFILAVIRDLSGALAGTDLGDLARVAASGHAHQHHDLLDRVASALHGVGLSLNDAARLPHEVAVQRITAAVRQLDDIIREILTRVLEDGTG